MTSATTAAPTGRPPTRRHVSTAIGGLLLGLAACSSGGAPALAPAPAPAPAPTATAAASTPTPPAAARPGTDPVTFFRSLEAGCKAYGGVDIGHSLFAGARSLRDLGNGSTLIEDGNGTRLVVVPRRGVVLPSTGDADDLAPMPYRNLCSPKVFLGTTDH